VGERDGGKIGGLKKVIGRYKKEGGK